MKRLLLAFSREVQERALDRVPEDLRAYFVGELRRPKVCLGMDGERCIFALAARGAVCSAAQRTSGRFARRTLAGTKSSRSSGACQLRRARRQWRADCRRSTRTSSRASWQRRALLPERRAGAAALQ